MPSDERRSSERQGTPVEPPESSEGERTSSSSDDTDGDSRATREDPTRDCPPEAFAGSAAEWSDLDDMDRRIAVFTSLPVEARDPSILVPNGVSRSGRGHDLPGSTDEDRATADGVDASTCAEIRRTMNDALTAREVVESYPDLHTSRIMRHAYGECNHETVDVPATASPQIGANECHSMRDDYRQGDRVTSVAEEWSRSENTVTRHIFGRCSHEPRPRELSPSEVAPEECDRVRRTFEGNQKVSVREVAYAMRIRREVTATHLFDYCRHAGEENPDRDPADPDDARLWDGRDA